MQIRRLCEEVYWKLERVIAPGLRYAQEVYEDTLAQWVTPRTRWLDLGCGHQVLPSWRLTQERRLVDGAGVAVGIDYDSPSLGRHRTLRLLVRGDIAQLPFRDGTFDLITANMVVEHLGHPANAFREIRRTLRPGGIFLVHTPNLLGYPTILARLAPGWLKRRAIAILDGRRAEDVFRTYYRANSRKGLSELSRMSGFKPLSIEAVVTSAVFAVVTPIAVVELLWIRLLMTKPFRPLRTNVIGVLRARGST